MGDASSSSPDGEISAPFISDIEVADFFMVLSPVLVYVSSPFDTSSVDTSPLLLQNQPWVNNIFSRAFHFNRIWDM